MGRNGPRQSGFITALQNRNAGCRLPGRFADFPPTRATLFLRQDTRGTCPDQADVAAGCETGAESLDAIDV